MKVSVIIVHYHVKKQLFTCIQSLVDAEPKLSFEIIVVDNDEEKTIEKELKKKFPQVYYIPNENKGFGEGNNIGAAHAKGEYLFFLNPDTEVFPQTVTKLLTFLKKHSDLGIVAPLLLGTDKKPYPQGSLKLTPQRGIFALSFLNKLFPWNPITRSYFLSDWNKKIVKEVDVAPGTAFMMKKSLFRKMKGFDEKFFLFFEEFDLCKRIQQEQYKIAIYPEAKVIHEWGVSTKQRKDIQTIFEKSRFYYFRKHFGLFSALLVEAFARVSKYTFLLFIILILGLFLRIQNINQSMSLIGDQGWFYLSARDLLLGKSFPLVGIASSHPWLHQGALWTYFLSIAFILFGFNPLVGTSISIGFGILAIVAIYFVGKMIFSEKIGIIAATFLATSPFVINNDRMPYHTSPIPFFVILFIYAFYKWLKGNSYFFPILIFLLGILYNLEIATSVLGIGTFVFCIYSFAYKKPWLLSVLNKRIMLLSIGAFTLSMFSMLVYDVSHDFPQTIGFLLWIGYRILVLFGYPQLHGATYTPFQELFFYAMNQLSTIILPVNKIIAFIVLIVSSFIIIRSIILHHDKRFELIFLVVLNLVCIGGFFAAKTASDAYLPMMVPGIVFMLSVSSAWLSRNKKINILNYIFYISVISFNSYTSFEMNSSNHAFAQRIDVAKSIVKEAGGKEYNLKGIGNGSQFASFTMNYEYLTWYLGNGPTKKKEPLEFVIQERPDSIILNKIIK